MGRGYSRRTCAVLLMPVAHALDAARVHQIDDQLDLVQTFEVGHLGRVTGFHQRLEAGLHERGESAAEHRLLAEQIRFASPL